MKKWIIGAAVAGIGSATLIYLLSEEKQAYQMPLTRTVMLSILNEYKRDLIGPLISLANLVLSIKSELNNLKKSELKSIIDANCNDYSANILSQLKIIKKRILTRYNTNSKAVNKAFDQEFFADK